MRMLSAGNELMENAQGDGGGLWAARGGSGGRLLLLLHGLGANASVWAPMLALIESSWQGRWLAPDLRGHARSPHDGPFDYAAHAADAAALIRDEPPGTVFIVGHSFGGVIGALLASSGFGMQPGGLFAFGVKLDWTENEVNKCHEIARKPRRTFATREEATERFLKASGLDGLLEPGSADAALGVEAVEGGYRVSVDPRVYSAIGPSIPEIFARVRVPLRLAAGGRDPMVAADRLRQIDHGAVFFEDAGHSVHYEAPSRMWPEILTFLKTSIEEPARAAIRGDQSAQ